MNDSIKLQSWNAKTLEILKILKNNRQKMIFSKMGQFFDFSKKKNGMNVTELCKVYMFTNFQVDILKNDRVLVF